MNAKCIHNSKVVTNTYIEVKTAFLGDAVPNFAEYDLIILHQLPAAGRNFAPVIKQIKDLVWPINIKDFFFLCFPIRICFFSIETY